MHQKKYELGWIEILGQMYRKSYNELAFIVRKKGITSDLFGVEYFFKISATSLYGQSTRKKMHLV